MSKTPPRTIREWVRWGVARFKRARLHFGHGTDNAGDEAFYLVTFALNLPHDLSESQLNRALIASEQAAVRSLLEKRVKTRTPAAYLTGEAWFAGLPFYVDEGVLIPRSPIGELIVDRFRPWLVRDPKNILDLCAGSGCIGIACARAFPRATVDTGELDARAMTLLRRNIRRHRLGRRVRALQSDLFQKFKGLRYDLIVSNPPYVPAARWKAMPAEHRHEPRLALVAGGDGMDIVQRILREAPDFLSPGGTLVCEVGGSVPEFNLRFPDLPVLWPEFEHGGDGVFIVSRNDLIIWNQKNVR